MINVTRYKHIQPPPLSTVKSEVFSYVLNGHEGLLRRLATIERTSATLLEVEVIAMTATNDSPYGESSKGAATEQQKL